MWMWKRWWAFTVILTLSLSLTSCANRKKGIFALQSAGQGSCLGSVTGTTVTYPSVGQGYFETHIFVDQVYSELPPVQIAVAYLNESGYIDESRGISVINPYTTIHPGQEIILPPRFMSDYSWYNYILVIPIDPTYGNDSISSFYAHVEDLSAACYYPAPGSGSGF